MGNTTQKGETTATPKTYNPNHPNRFLHHAPSANSILQFLTDLNNSTTPTSDLSHSSTLSSNYLESSHPLILPPSPSLLSSSSRINCSSSVSRDLSEMSDPSCSTYHPSTSLPTPSSTSSNQTKDKIQYTAQHRNKPKSKSKMKSASDVHASSDTSKSNSDDQVHSTRNNQVSTSSQVNPATVVECNASIMPPLGDSTDSKSQTAANSFATFKAASGTGLKGSAQNWSEEKKQLTQSEDKKEAQAVDNDEGNGSIGVNKVIESTSWIEPIEEKASSYPPSTSSTSGHEQTGKKEADLRLKEVVACLIILMYVLFDGHLLSVSAPPSICVPRMYLPSSSPVSSNSSDNEITTYRVESISSINSVNGRVDSSNSVPLEAQTDSLKSCIERFLLCEHKNSPNILLFLGALYLFNCDSLSRRFGLVSLTSLFNLPFKWTVSIGFLFQLIYEIKNCSRVSSTTVNRNSSIRMQQLPSSVDLYTTTGASSLSPAPISTPHRSVFMLRSPSPPPASNVTSVDQQLAAVGHSLIMFAINQLILKVYFRSTVSQSNLFISFKTIQAIYTSINVLGMLGSVKQLIVAYYGRSHVSSRSFQSDTSALSPSSLPMILPSFTFLQLTHALMIRKRRAREEVVGAMFLALTDKLGLTPNKVNSAPILRVMAIVSLYYCQ